MQENNHRWFDDEEWDVAEVSGTSVEDTEFGRET